MQADGAGNAVDQSCVRHRLWDDVAQVELEEEYGSRHPSLVCVYVADFDQDQEDQGDEIEEGGREREVESRSRCCFDGGFGGLAAGFVRGWCLVGGGGGRGVVVVIGLARAADGDDGGESHEIFVDGLKGPAVMGVVLSRKKRGAATRA